MLIKINVKSKKIGLDVKITTVTSNITKSKIKPLSVIFDVILFHLVSLLKVKFAQVMLHSGSILHFINMRLRIGCILITPHFLCAVQSAQSNVKKCNLHYQVTLNHM